MGQLVAVVGQRYIHFHSVFKDDVVFARRAGDIADKAPDIAVDVAVLIFGL